MNTRATIPRAATPPSDVRSREQLLPIPRASPEIQPEPRQSRDRRQSISNHFQLPSLGQWQSIPFPLTQLIAPRQIESIDPQFHNSHTPPPPANALSAIWHPR